LCEIAAVLPGDTGDQRLLHFVSVGWFLVFRYQAIVSVRPSSKPIFASNPNRSLARRVSSLRRGWPFGRDLSQRTFPLNPHSFATNSVRSLIVISNPAPRFTGSEDSYRSAASTMPSA